VLLAAGYVKLRENHSGLLRAILAYDLLPLLVARLLAHWLPWLEVCIGVLLITGLLIQSAVVASFGLLTVFTGAVILALWHGKDINCGCFGKMKQLGGRRALSWRIVYRNLFLEFLLLFVFAERGHALSTGSSIDFVGLAVLGTVWLVGVSITLILQLNRRLAFHGRDYLTVRRES